MPQEKPELRRRVWIAAAVAATGVGTAAWLRTHRESASPAAGAQPNAGTFPAPLQTLDGKTLTNADIAGRAVVLNFWAPWCPPCIKEMPELDRFARSPAARATLVVGVAVDDRAMVEKFIRANPVAFPIVPMGFGGFSWVQQVSDQPNAALPFTAVYDRGGKLVQKKFGPTSEAELTRWITQT